MWFLAVAFISFSQLFALEFSTPIWASLLAPLFLVEALTRERVLAVMLGFTGALIVARPDFTQLDPAIVAAVSCAIYFAFSLMATKKLTSDQSITCILFWLTTMQLIMGLASTLFFGTITVPEGVGVMWIMSVGIGGLVTHFYITNALSIAPAIVAIPLGLYEAFINQRNWFFSLR